MKETKPKQIVSFDRHSEGRTRVLPEQGSPAAVSEGITARSSRDRSGTSGGAGDVRGVMRGVVRGFGRVVREVRGLGVCEGFGGV